jgi:carbamoyl-phosphate synthase large subunit
MRSTGEVMGIDTDFPRAYAKAQMAAAPALPQKGNLFVSVKDSDKQAIVPIVKDFADLGFKIHATDGTAALLQENGIPVTRLNKIAQGRPNVVDMIKNGEMHFIINTPAGKQPRADEVVIRATAVGNRIPIMTTLRAAAASVQAIRSIAEKPLEVKSLQEHHA